MRLAPAFSAVGPATLSLQVTQLRPAAEARRLAVFSSVGCSNCIRGWLGRAAEKQAADALANETNPWNTVYGMVEGQHPRGASQKYTDVLLSLKEKGKGSS